MDFCPKCNARLNADDKFSAKCSKCKANLEEFYASDEKRYHSTLLENTVAKAVKICGIIIIIVGTILSIVIACQKDKYGDLDFSFVRFITSEAISVISGIFFIGFSEVIQLLEDIKNKTK